MLHWTRPFRAKHSSEVFGEGGAREGVGSLYIAQFVYLTPADDEPLQSWHEPAMWPSMQHCCEE